MQKDLTSFSNPPPGASGVKATPKGASQESEPPEALSEEDFPVQRKNEPSDLAFSIAIFFVALVPRLFVAIAWGHEPVWDGHYYHFGAERIAEGFGYSEDVIIGGQPVWKPWTHYPVGYSGILAIFYKIFGSGVLTAPLVNSLIGALIAVVAHRLARYAISQNRARIAGGLCALHPGLIAYTAVVMTETTAAFFVLSAVWIAIAKRHNFWGYVGAGLLIGVGSLVRPASLLALPVLLLVGPRPLTRNLVRTIATGLIALVPILPWTLRNCQVMDGCALVSTNGGWNLAIGALTETGRFRTLRADDGCPVVTGQVQQDRCWAQVGRRVIERDPEAWLAKMPAKLGQTYNHESFPIDYLREASPELWPDERRKAGHDLLTLFHWLLMAAAALSPIALITSTKKRVSAATQSILLLMTAAYASYCFASVEHPFFALMVMTPLVALLPFPGRPSSGPAGRALYGLLFATTLTHAVFFGEDRYHLVITPVLCILAAAALRTDDTPAQWALR